VKNLSVITLRQTPSPYLFIPRYRNLESWILYLSMQKTQMLLFCQPLLSITHMESSPSNERRTSSTAQISAQKIIIVPLHIFSGCGTTSGFYGYGKKTVYDKISKSEEACSLLQQVGKQLPVTNEVTDHLAHLNIRYLYNDKLRKCWGKLGH